METLLKWLLRSICNIDVDKLNAIIARKNHEATSLNEQISQLTTETCRQENHIQALQEELNATIEKKAKNASEQNALVCQLTAETSDLRGQLNTLRRALDYNAQSLADSRKSLEDAKHELMLLSNEQSCIKKENDALSKELADLKSKKATEQRIHLQQQDQTENLQGQCAEIARQLDLAKNENIARRNDVCRLKSTIDILRQEKADLLSRLAAKPISQDGTATKKGSITANPENPHKTILSHFEKISPVANETQATPEKDTVETRSIDTVTDVETGDDIDASTFFAQPESVVFQMRKSLEEAIYLHQPKLVCKYCGQMVRIAGRATERGRASFFSHLRDSDECDRKTTTGLSKKEIERRKYARCNEGERHKRLKQLLASYLNKTDGVENVAVESTVLGNHPLLYWRRPDVMASYMGKDFVFELQLTTTFVSAIVERDLFYRLNKKYIIWVFNFDEQQEHVNLDNMMVKDIYYNNKFNIFIFDKEAQEESERRGQLVLRCNWLLPDNSWHYSNDCGRSDAKQFITLSQLQLDDTYKPYIFDAEALYYAAHPEIEARVRDIEAENQRVIATLNQRLIAEQQQHEQRKYDMVKRSADIAHDYDAEVVKTTPTFLIASRDGHYGLLTYDYELRIPFEYDSITSRQSWIECVKDDLISIYTTRYELLLSSIRRIETLDIDIAKYAKEADNAMLWGLMTKTRRKITDAIFSSITLWREGAYIAVKQGLYCIITSDGHVLLDGCDQISALDNNKCATVSMDGRHWKIDSNGNNILKNRITLSNGYTKVEQMGQWGICNANNDTVTPFQYDEIGTCGEKTICLNGFNFTVSESIAGTDCPVKCRYLRRGLAGKLIFEVGHREAFMNARQQKKAVDKGITPTEISEMYFSCFDPERNLLYLSASPVKKYCAPPHLTSTARSVNDTPSHD